MAGLCYALWNERDLCPPPSYTHRTSKGNRTFVELRSVCLKALSILTSLDVLRDEGAVLSRMIYHLKCKLRTEKGFKIVEKVNRGLKRYLSLNMAHVYSTFTPREPDRTEMEGYLPSQQMLEFVLVRTQSFARIFKYVADTCEEAGRELAMKLAVGHMWSASLVLYAIISRIWAYARYLVFSACEWFNKLKPFLDLLVPNPTPWLPEGYSYPSDLAGWLNIGTWTEAPRPTLVPHTQRLFNLITSKADEKLGHDMETESDDETRSSLLAVNSKENVFDADIKSSVEHMEHGDAAVRLLKKHSNKKKKLKSDTVDTSWVANNLPQKGDDAELHTQEFDTTMETAPSHVNILHTICEVEDVGESVSRETVAVTSNTAGKHSPEAEEARTQVTKRCSIKAISSHVELSALICRESRLRGGLSKGYLTSSLDKLRWRLLRKALRKYVRKLEQETSKRQYKKLLKEAKQILRQNVL